MSNLPDVPRKLYCLPTFNAGRRNTRIRFGTVIMVHMVRLQFPSVKGDNQFFLSGELLWILGPNLCELVRCVCLIGAF